VRFFVFSILRDVVSLHMRAFRSARLGYFVFLLFFLHVDNRTTFVVKINAHAVL